MTFEEWYGKDLTGTTYNDNLSCYGENITSLKGCPELITGGFSCSENNLTSLEHGPTQVNGSFYCNDNNLTSLKGCPKIIKGSFYCYNNDLTSLDHTSFIQSLFCDFDDECVLQYNKKHFPEMII